mmetsp:Transcript_4083/g.12937  ORF Transcript_4083/g.12937 Transcript_4083/m.12937 type:complete len:288 (-) Transcript_4083:270-1133(-)
MVTRTWSSSSASSAACAVPCLTWTLACTTTAHGCRAHWDKNVTRLQWWHATTSWPAVRWTWRPTCKQLCTVGHAGRASAGARCRASAGTAAGSSPGTAVVRRQAAGNPGVTFCVGETASPTSGAASAWMTRRGSALSSWRWATHGTDCPPFRTVHPRISWVLAAGAPTIFHASLSRPSAAAPPRRRKKSGPATVCWRTACAAGPCGRLTSVRRPPFSSSSALHSTTIWVAGPPATGWFQTCNCAMRVCQQSASTLDSSALAFPVCVAVWSPPTSIPALADCTRFSGP